MTATAARHMATFLLEVALDEERIKQRLAAALRAWRGGRAQLDVYALTGLSYRQYQRLENAQSMPRWKNLEQLAERTGIDMASIVGEDEEPILGLAAPSGGEERALAEQVLEELRSLREGQDAFRSDVDRRLAALEARPVPGKRSSTTR